VVAEAVSAGKEEIIPGETWARAAGERSKSSSYDYGGRGRFMRMFACIGEGG
jgi:hypothetical protein